jgi:hypothetical protein
MNTESTYLQIAKDKYKQSNDVNYDLTLNDFVADCYARLKPCSYGSRIQSKIVNDLSVTSIPPSLNMGDVLLGNKSGEIKSSFLDKKYSYNLTHLRMWQKFQYYLFCFIDCENDFIPEFYLLDKYILDSVKKTPMNGTKESNSDNTNIELRATVKKNGETHKLFMKKNKLSGTSFNDLKKFVDSLK